MTRAEKAELKRRAYAEAVAWLTGSFDTDLSPDLMDNGEREGFVRDFIRNNIVPQLDRKAQP